MNYRKLGRSNFKVSEIGLGTSQLANLDGTYPGTKQISRDVAERILSQAFEAGVNFFDTADNYGEAEALLGALPSSAKQKIFVSTKAGWRPNADRCFTKSYLTQQLEASLRKLKRDVIDLFQVNKPSLAQIEQDEIYDTLETLKKQGKIRHAGMVIGSAEVGHHAIASGVIDSLMVLYHLLYHETSELIHDASRKGIGIIVRSPFSSGLLSGKITRETKFTANDARGEVFTQALLEERLSLLEPIQNEFAIRSEELLGFALRFILSHPGVSTVIPGPSTVEQVHELTQQSNGNLLSQAHVRRIEEVVRERSVGLLHGFQL